MIIEPFKRKSKLRKDLTGKKFGRWTVVEVMGVSGRSGTVYKCRCKCGTVKAIRSYSLTSGRSTSCGCSR